MAKVILVDDDRSNAMLIKTLLEMDGFEVGAYPDASSARSTAWHGAHAFVIDCHLTRDRDGLELLRAIRKGQTGAPGETPVIVTSGDIRVRDAAMEAGATMFFPKPFSPADLSRHLKQLVDNQFRSI